MIVLGLNAYHGDSAACLVRDGTIVAAAEEERFRRVKHWAGFPSEAIRYCLAEARATLGDVAHVAVNSDPAASFLKKVGYALRQRPDLGLLFDRARNQARRQSIEAELAHEFPGVAFRGAVHRVEHHLAHMASAFLVSPFAEASIVSVDGFGDFASAAWGVGRGNAIDVEGRVYFPHSLGVFYQALTQFIGFPHYGDEYKVMGLAPYGEPRFEKLIRDHLIAIKDDGSFRLDLSYFDYCIGTTMTAHVQGTRFCHAAMTPGCRAGRLWPRGQARHCRHRRSCGHRRSALQPLDRPPPDSGGRPLPVLRVRIPGAHGP